MLNILAYLSNFYTQRKTIFEWIVSLRKYHKFGAVFYCVFSGVLNERER